MIDCRNVPFKVKRSEFVQDWYVVVRTHHDGKTWLEPAVHEGVPYLSLKTSERLSDADIEGTREEMIALMTAILDGKEASFKRCGAEPVDDGWLLGSPRNSTEWAFVSTENARKAAQEFLDEHVTDVSRR